MCIRDSLAIAEIAADYSTPVGKLFSLCNQLLIAYKHQKTHLGLEDAKAIFCQIQILSETHPKGNSDLAGDIKIT